MAGKEEIARLRTRILIAAISTISALALAEITCRVLLPSEPSLRFQQDVCELEPQKLDEAALCLCLIRAPGGAPQGAGSIHASLYRAMQVKTARQYLPPRLLVGREVPCAPTLSAAAKGLTPRSPYLVGLRPRPPGNSSKMLPSHLIMAALPWEGMITVIGSRS